MNQKTIKQLIEENHMLKEQLTQAEKDYNILFNAWSITEDNTDCYKCICGIVTECNCYHLGFRPSKSKK